MEAPLGRPILLGLADEGALEGWRSGLWGFHVLRAGDLASAATLARRCRPDLLLIDGAWSGDLPPDRRERFPDSPLGWLPVVIVGSGVPCPGTEDEIDPALAPEEAAIRIRAVLRRQRPTALADVLSWGGIELRHDERKVLIEGRAVHPSFHEFNLLALLIEAPGRVWPREDLRRALWGPGARGEMKSLDRLVHGLRRQIAPLLGRDPIEAVRGRGYRLA